METPFRSLVPILIVLASAQASGAGLWEVCVRVLRGGAESGPAAAVDPIVAQNLANLGPNGFPREDSHASSTEPNAFWDTDCFGWGFRDRRPSTTYRFVAVTPEGVYRTRTRDLETQWGSTFPGVKRGLEPSATDRAPPETLPVIFAARYDGWTTMILPSQLSAAGRRRVLETERARTQSDSIVALLRRYNSAERELLDRMNEIPANYRAYLYRRMNALARELRDPITRTEAKQRELDTLREKIRELRRFHKVDIPPNTAEGLVYRGEGAPPLPNGCTLHEPTMSEIGRSARYAVYRGEGGRYDLVEIEATGAGDTATYRIRSIGGYTDATVRITLEGGPSDPGTITPLLPAEREPTGNPYVLTAAELGARLDRFRVTRP